MTNLKKHKKYYVLLLFTLPKLRTVRLLYEGLLEILSLVNPDTIRLNEETYRLQWIYRIKTMDLSFYE